MKEKKNIDTLFQRLGEAENQYFPNKERIWDKIEQELDEETPVAGKKFNYKWAVAASFVVVSVLAVIIFNPLKDKQAESMVQNIPENNVSDAPTGSDDLANAKQIDGDSVADTERAKTIAEYSDILQKPNEAEIYAYEDAQKQTNEDIFFKTDKKDNYGVSSNQNSKKIQDSIPSEKYGVLWDFSALEDNDLPVNRGVESRSNTEIDMETAEISMPVSEEKVSTKDFYFVNGKKVQKEEMQALSNDDRLEMNYLSHDEAAKIGYISNYKNGNVKGEVQEVFFWKDIKPADLKKEEVPVVYAQLQKIDTVNFTSEDMKQLEDLKKTLQNKMKSRLGKAKQ